MAAKLSAKSPAIKRILADVRELNTHPSARYHANPLEENMFEWHFTIRGPSGTPFEQGAYHGRILLPSEYPFKPPNIVFMTPNGRFQVGVKICLSISAYHPEHWQPAWGVRTILEALISFLPSEGAGAIGALDWTAEERQKLAKESLNFECAVCGRVEKLLRENGSIDTTEAEKGTEGDERVPQLHLHYLSGPENEAREESNGLRHRSLTDESSRDTTETKEQDSAHVPEASRRHHAPIPGRETYRRRDTVDTILLIALVLVGLMIILLLLRKIMNRGNAYATGEP